MVKPVLKLWPVLTLLLLAAIGALIAVLFSPAAEKPLRIGTNVWPGYEHLYLARELGYLDSDQLHLVELSSASQVSDALRQGTLEAAALTLDEVLTLLEQGVQLTVVLVLDYSAGGDVLLAHPQIGALSDLKGKQIAVETGAVGAVLLDGALQAGGLQSDDVELIECAAGNHLHCFDSVDAVVTFEPARSQLLEKGARLLFDSSQIPGRIMDVLVVKREWLGRGSGQIEALLQAYFKARHYWQQEPLRAAELMAPRLGVANDRVAELFDGLILPTLAENRELLAYPDGQLLKLADELAALMVERRLLASKPETSYLSSGQFLPGMVR